MISSVGSRELAWSVAQKMFAESIAYNKFLLEKLPIITDTNTQELHKFFEWNQLPLVTKSNFYGKHALKDLIPESNKSKIYSYTRSSGTSSSAASGQSKNAKGFFWPEMKAPTSELAQDFEVLLRQMVTEVNEPTMLIVGLSLGSWAGGEQMSFSSRINALDLGHSFVVFSPGNNHEEIIEAIQVHHQDFKRIIIGCCPSAIFYLMKMSKEMGAEFPLEKITFLVTGEPFAEEYRIELQKQAGAGRKTPVMCSLYSSADTGVLGVESSHLIQIRQRILQNPSIGEFLKLDKGSLPNFFHLNSKDRFFENIDGNLVVTMWQGLPLVRYNLEDRVQLFSWKELSDAMIKTASTDREKKLWRLLNSYNLPDVVAVYGRSNGCLFLCGSNIFDSMLEEVLLGSEMLKGKVTGHFVVWVGVSKKGQQQLHWKIEMKDQFTGFDSVFTESEGSEGIQELKHKLNLEFADLLGRLQPEFKEDYAKFYSTVSSIEDNIFQFHFCKSGQVESMPRYYTSVGKRRIVQDRNPTTSHQMLT